ncbi:MAG: hypothetical protein ABIK28_24230 [Planctomycetota bacterium]
MTSNEQQAANQKNALASTGPRTDVGKDIVSKNAIRHGILSKSVVLRHGQLKEDPEEYAALLAGIMDDWQPCGTTEYFLCEKIAAAIWRSRRVVRWESALIDADFTKRKHLTDNHFNSAWQPGSLPALRNVSAGDAEQKELQERRRQDLLDRLSGLSFLDESQVNRIARYSQSLDKELYRAMSALATLKQSKRRYKPCEYTKKVGRQYNPETVHETAEMADGGTRVEWTADFEDAECESRACNTGGET